MDSIRSFCIREMLLVVRAVPDPDEDGQRDDGAPCFACKVRKV